MTWNYPSLSLLTSEKSEPADRGDIKQIAAVIEKTLQGFKIEARIAEVNLGPTLTQYALQIGAGTKISDIKALTEDIALATEAPTGQIRIEAPIPGRNLIGLEIVNKTAELVRLQPLLASQIMQHAKSKLSLPLGLDVTGHPVITDLARLPHLLIAGNPRAGKSTVINSFITSLLFRSSPAEVRIILVDTKSIELSVYNGVPHLLTPVINDEYKILSALKWVVGEVERRHKIFSGKGVKNIDSYNQAMGFQELPYIVLIIDDVEQLFEGFIADDAKDTIARITRLGHSAGVHVILATQKPSSDIFPPQIKSCIPARLGLFLPRKLDFSVTLDIPDTDRLLGNGDMFFLEPSFQKPLRIQGSFLSEKEIQNVVAFVASQATVSE